MSKDRVSRHGTADAAVDAGRGLSSPRGSTAARAHFASCARCRENINLWKSFAVVTQRLREAEPPEGAVGKVKALALGTSRGPSRVTPLTRMKNAPSYESLWVPPAAAGARGAASDHAVYRAEEFSVDLRVSRERAHVVIVGQITNVRRPTQRFALVPVALLAEDTVVVRAFSNERGEFQVEHREQEQMWIEVAPQEGRLIRIPVRPRQMAS
jgi:hypothetical protein